MVAFSNKEGSEVRTSNQPQIQFCPYCGTKLDEGASFCKNCGSAVKQTQNQRHDRTGAETFEGNPTVRKTVYEGSLHKCPNCGEVLQAFVAVCPSCGHEIRDVKSATAVRELASKLERISAQKMPVFEEKKSVMKMVFGKDFKEEDEAEEAQKRFDEQQNQEKASLIINFSVPNTKEDILEFMILAASNIDTKHGIDDPVTKAWISKLNQVYQRAEITMRGQQDFEQIQKIYELKKAEIKKKKVKKLLMGAAPVAGWFFLMGMLWDSTVTIIVTVAVLALLVGGFLLFRKK